jgi:transposase
MDTRKAVEARVAAMLPHLDERQRRLFLASEAIGIGRGGVKAVHEISGVSQTTIIKGKRELGSGEAAGATGVRRGGGGRKGAATRHEGITDAIERIVESDTYGGPEQVLVWTTKSLRNIEGALKGQGYDVSHETVGSLLKGMGYSLQQNQKMMQLGEPSPDRDAQFNFINKKCARLMKRGQPVISVDTKKKELVGNFKNGGVEYCGEKSPLRVLDHDFPIKELGKVAPYGIYDVGKNEGFVNLGTSHDTSEFAVGSILRWWMALGANTYSGAGELYITCDSGGSNGTRRRLWKVQLQGLADLTGLTVHVSHFPPGTSKWNKIEHKMFCYISKNWRGRPLVSVEAVVSLIGSTTTSKGLRITCVEDRNEYALGTVVTDEELAAINITKDEFHGEWNYSIAPR